MATLTVNNAAPIIGSNYGTIQAALTAAVDGDTINVSAGTYVENLSITTNNITLVSVDGRDATTITGISGAGSLGTIVLANGVNGVTIGDGAGTGFTINGIDNGNPAVENAAIYIQGAHDGLTFKGNDIVANGDSGMTSEYSAVVTNVVVDGNIFSGQTFTGANPGGEGFGSQFTEFNVPRQLVLLGANGQNTSGVTFTNNQITGTAGGTNIAGEPQGNTLVTIDAANSTISGNEFTGFTNRYASQLRVREDATDITNNSYSNDAGGNVGVYMDLSGGESAGSIYGNTLTYGDGDDLINAAIGNESIDGGDGTDTYDMTGAGAAGGLVDLGSGYSFSSQTGFDHLSNIENANGSLGDDALMGSVGDNVFKASGGSDNIDGRGGSDTFDASDARSTVDANLSTGAVSGEYDATLTAIENVLTGEGADTVVTSASDNTVSTGAGDDSITASAGTDAIDGGADFDTVTFDGDRGDYTVTWDGTAAAVEDNAGNVTTIVNAGLLDFATGGDVRLVGGTGDYTTIQAAVDAAGDGDEILVSTGTYTEQVTVDNFAGLTLTATGEVTIKAPADVVNNGGISNWSRPINAVVAVGDSTDVVLNGFTVDGDGQADSIDGPGARFFGVSFHESSGGLENVDIIGVRHPYDGGTTSDGFPVVSGAQDAHGLHVDNQNATQLDFFMHGGSISDFQKNATLIYNANLDIDGVTITGGGSQPINGQNGIQVYDSTGTIQNSTIQDIGYSGLSNVSSSMVLLRSNINLKLINNTLTGADDDAAKVRAVFVGDTGGNPSSGGEIKGNTISGVDIGILVDGTVDPSGIDISDNDISGLDATNMDAAGVVFAPLGGAAVSYNIEGSAASDHLTGGSVGDVLSGLAGDDYIDGKGGADGLSGGAGDDTFNYSDAADFVMGETVDGGDDDDTIEFDSATGGTLTLSAGVTNVENVTVSDEGNIDASTVGNGLNITGSDGDNMLIGTAFNDAIEGGDGADVLTGGGGVDIIDGGADFDTVTFDGNRVDYTVTWDGTTATVTKGADVTTITNSGVLSFASGGDVRLVSTTGDYTTIQDAVDDSGDGDEIMVGAGSFAGAAIDVDITLSGMKAGEAGYDNLSLAGVARAATGETIITSTFDSQGDDTAITIEGFRFENTKAYESQNARASLTFKNNVIINGDNQIASGVAGAGTVVVSGNYINSGTYNGFMVNGHGNGTAEATFTDNLFNGTGVGPVGGSAVVASSLAEFEFSNNVVMNTDSHGIQIADGMGNVTIDGNTFDTTVTSGKTDRGAISVKNVQDFTGDLDITNNTVTNSPYGVAYRADDDADTTGLTINLSGNDFSAASVAGVAYVGNAEANVLTGGAEAATFVGNAGDDVITGGGGDDTIDGGDGLDTATFAGDRGDYTVTWDGTTATVDDGAGSVATVTNAGILDFATGGDVRLVSTTGDYTSIQAAVTDSSDGDVVYVGAGTFAEAIVVDKDIIINGANMGTDGEGVRVAETIIDGSIHVKAAGAGSTIDGVKIVKESVVLGSQIHGVYVQSAADVTITNSILIGDDNGRGVLWSTGGTGGLTVSNNSISGWHSGMYLNQGSSAVVTGNTFEDNGNHINNDGADLSNVSGNTFTNAAGSQVAIGVLPPGATSADFVGANTFDTTTNEVSVYLSDPAKTVVGSVNDDNFWDSAAAHTISGGEGDDRLQISNAAHFAAGETFDGGAGNDSIIFRAGTASTLTVSSDVTNVENVTAISGSVALNIDASAVGNKLTINGNSAANQLTGTAFADSINGGEGDDIINGGDGNDLLDGGAGADSLFGGAGTDTVTYANSALGVTANLAASMGSGGDAQGDIYSGISNLIGTAFNDTLIGRSDANEIEGGDGIDFISGGAGDDTLDGGGDNDIIIGGAGDDRVYDRSGDDDVQLGDGDDYVRAGGGADYYDGGSGTDYISYYSSSNGVDLDFAANTATGSWANNDTVINFEGASGSKTGDDTIRGTDGENLIRTYGGNDLIETRGGDDDVYDGSGDDTVNLGAGDDYVRAGGGADYYDGGDGNDYISYYDSSNGVNLDFAANTASRSWASNDTVLNFEGASGSKTGDDTIKGTDGENTIRTYGGDDKLHGRGGDDSLDGGSGNDSLYGASGSDTMKGGDGDDYLDGGAGTGTDYLYGGSGADEFHFDRGEGYDVIKDFEDDIDTLALDNFSGFTTAADALVFATEVDGDVLFDFGTDGSVLVENTTMALLMNDIEIV
ncbi:right-handed parallel beta-helix repeat-containing protein [Rhodobacteraceae bacterium KMM 6894]|nr:right-handed parallel beta-helix repeat-containing protein [Rhodobacteraceae bacterium KMM 6894]